MKPDYTRFSAVPTRIALRGLTLLLLFASIFGPWGFSSDGVPPPEWCREPHFLVESDSPYNPPLRCVRYLPGSEGFLVWQQVLVYLPALLFSGQLSLEEIGREMLFFLTGLAFYILPFASMLIVMATGETRGARIFNASAWALAGILLLWFFVNNRPPFPWRLWGILLYLSLVLAVLLFELLTALQRRRASPL